MSSYLKKYSKIKELLGILEESLEEVKLVGKN